MKSLNRHTLIVIAALFAVLALLAAAGRAAAAVPTLEDDVAVARAYWGWQHSPYCTTETITEQVILWGGEEENSPYWREPGPCTIRVITIGQLEERMRYLLPGEGGYVPDPSEYPAKARELRCRIVVHEVGHMFGLPHSPDPANIMFWKISFAAVIPACEARMHEAEPAPVKRHRQHRRFARGSVLSLR